MRRRGGGAQEPKAHQASQESLRLRRGVEMVAHARSTEQAMPPGPTLDREG